MNFIGAMPLKTHAEKDFLSNTKNKQRFIDMLSAAGLRDNGLKRCWPTNYPDSHRAYSQGATSLIGEDTDLLVLLCFHADANLHPLYFGPEKNRACEKTGCGVFIT